MRRALVLSGVLVLAAMPLLAGGEGHGGCCAKQAGVQRTVTKLDNGVRITMSASDPKAIAMLQEKPAAADQGCCASCPMHAEGVTRTVEKTDSGVIVTATAKDPALVAKLQQHAEMMGAAGKTGSGCCKGAGAGCPHGKDAAAAKT